MGHVFNWLRARLRAWLGVSEPVVAPTIEAEAKRKGISIAAEVLARAGEKPVHRKLIPPALPPGVIPETHPIDDPGNLGAFIGDSELTAPLYAYANQFNCGLAFPGYAYLSELSQRSEYRAASETIASEMTREFIKLVVKNEDDSDEEMPDDESETDAEGKPVTKMQKLARVLSDTPITTDFAVTEPDDTTDLEGNGNSERENKIAKLEEALEDFKVRQLLKTMVEYDGFFGRGQLFIDVDSKRGNTDEVRQLPLVIDAATIPKGSLKGFKAVEPIWTTPYTYNATDPTADDFYKPRAWYVMGKRIHATRLLTFIMRPVSDILKPSYNFGGLSMTQLMESDVFQWLRTRNSVSDLIHNFSVMCLATDMGNILEGGTDKPGGVMDRAKMFVQTRDNQGLTLLDKEREEMVAVNVPLSTLDKLQAQAQEHMAAPSHIPLVKLLGITPSGLNASSEGEIRVFYDFVRACQQVFFSEHVNTILQILQLHLFGNVDDSIGFEFINLTAPTVKELAEIRKANADTDAAYIDKGVLDPAEVRGRLASDPDSGYNNLSGEPPDPPELIDHQLGEKTAATAHERGEESAEAAHARQLEADKMKSAAAA